MPLSRNPVALALIHKFLSTPSRLGYFGAPSPDRFATPLQNYRASLYLSPLVPLSPDTLLRPLGSLGAKTRGGQNGFQRSDGNIHDSWLFATAVDLSCERRCDALKEIFKAPDHQRCRTLSDFRLPPWTPPALVTLIAPDIETALSGAGRASLGHGAGEQAFIIDARGRDYGYQHPYGQ